MDWRKLTSQRRLGASPYSEEQRTPFQRDQDRIIFSAAFRRLQDKTQVHPFPDSDYVRRRLTHSIEVSCVGRSLGTYFGQRLVLKALTDLEPGQLKFDLGQIVTNACLAHDIGNPPFGHAGERAIGSFFTEHLASLSAGTLTEQESLDLTKFEGNAQGFRLISRLQDFREDGGLRLTCATLAAFIKYPTSSVGTQEEYVGFKKHGFFANDVAAFEEVADEVDVAKFESGRRRHPLAYLMEAADDICYRVIDIEDAFKLGRLPYEQVREIFEGIIHERIKYEVGWNEGDTVSWLRAKAIGVLISETCQLIEREMGSICDGTWARSLLDSVPASPNLREAFGLVKSRVFNWDRTISAELAGAQMIQDVLSKLVDAVEKPKTFKNEMLLRLLSNYREELTYYEKMLLVTDFVSGMTDSYLQRIHRRLTGQSIW